MIRRDTVTQALVSMRSLVTHSREKVHIHLTHDRHSMVYDRVIRPLTRLIADGIVNVNFTHSLARTLPRRYWGDTAWHLYGSMNKLYVMRDNPDVRRGVLLDSDTVFEHDPAPWFDTMHGSAWMGMYREGRDLNAGVVLVDFEKGRKTSFDTFVDTYDGDLGLFDQSIVNAYLRKHPNEYVELNATIVYHAVNRGFFEDPDTHLMGRYYQWWVHPVDSGVDSHCTHILTAVLIIGFAQIALVAFAAIVVCIRRKGYTQLPASDPGSLDVHTSPSLQRTEGKSPQKRSVLPLTRFPKDRRAPMDRKADTILPK